jgi:hypothetical protein
MVKFKKICNIDFARDLNMSFGVELEAEDFSDSGQVTKILYKRKRRRSITEPLHFSSDTEIFISTAGADQTLSVKNNIIDSSQHSIISDSDILDRRKRRNSLDIPPNFVTCTLENIQYVYFEVLCFMHILKLHSHTLNQIYLLKPS